MQVPRRRLDPDAEPGSRGDESGFFDFARAWSEQGLACLRRPEHIEAGRMVRLARLSARALEKGRPWMPKSTAELRHWAPRATLLGPMLQPEKKAGSSFSLVAQLVRRRATWLLTMVALKQITAAATLSYILELLEISESTGLAGVVSYDTHKMAALQEQVDLLSTTDLPSEGAGEYKNLVTQALLNPRHDLLQALLFQRERAKQTATSKAAPPSRSTTRARSPPPAARASQRATSSSAHPPRRRPVCFDHNPVKGVNCSGGSSCTKEHLDTNLPDMLARWEAARAAFSRRPTRKPGRAQAPAPKK